MFSNNLNVLNEKKIIDSIINLENKLSANVLLINAPIYDPIDQITRKFVEKLQLSENKRENLYVLLSTYGGSAEVAEKVVKILRHFYSKIFFVITEYCYSAGTIMAMSGDRVYMNYYSVLGPIDPQVKARNGKFVSALNYLDKVAELVLKDKKGTISSAQFLALKEFDLGELKDYEQAKALSVDLASSWLYSYNLVESISNKRTRKLTATSIANELVNSSKWKTHGRPLTIDVIKNLKINVFDYKEEKCITSLVNPEEFGDLNDNFSELLEINGYSSGVVTREDKIYGRKDG